MKTAFIFHGTDDTPQSQWLPWLKKELEKQGYIVHIPQFPGIGEESFTSWYEVFHPYLHEVNQQTLFIGHSLGACFILQLLSTQNFQIRAAFLVGAWGEKLDEATIENHYQLFQKAGFTGEKELLYHYESFVEDLEFSSIKEHCDTFCIFTSTNDPYISLEISRNLGENLAGELYEIPHAGHFCKRDGYEIFPELLEKISSI